MVSYTWARGVSGIWNAPVSWLPAAVPNDIAADVTIDAPPVVAGPYDVLIAAGTTETVRSLSLNPTNNYLNTNVAPFSAAQLSIDGTLVFAPGSTGTLAGPLQNIMLMNGGTIVNPGTVNAFIQGRGNVLFTGTNGFYITNWLQSLSGNVTIDTASIAEMTGNTLFDGIFETQGVNAFINMGGPLQHLVVNIATIEGPPLIPNGWTEIFLDNPNADVREWNGAAYVSLETTLADIGARGTVDVLGGRAYATANTLTVAAGGLLNLQASAFNAAALDINGGLVQGSGTIGNGVVNTGILAAEGGALDIVGAVTGIGAMVFDFDHKAGTLSATGSVLEVHAVAAGQTVFMNGDDILKIDTPSTFAGAISANVGDQILLGGVSATSAVLTNGTLTLSNGTQVVDALRLSGSYAGDSFKVTPVAAGTTLTVTGPAPNFKIEDATTDSIITSTGSAYAGGPSGPQYEYANITPDSLYITSAVPSSFIQTGGGNDTIDVSKANGNNVLDAGTGSNTLIGGTGIDSFYVNDVAPAASISDLVENFHSGDYATIFGVYPGGFSVQAQTVLGAGNVSELQYSVSTASQPTATLTLAGHSFADITSGRITATFGTTTGTPTGTPILNIHAT
ncbi:hypothetical protein [Rhodopila sp.]|uniref:hypothetical protein n=1 Tax=Rhodopila sp. TaxID=2480087 RepID=UPI003D14EF52